MELDSSFLKEKHSQLGISFSLVDKANSTNDEAFTLLENSDFCAVVAKEQSAGRGRLGRKWEGEIGDCIFYSIGFKMPDSFNISLLTCVIAIEILNILDKQNNSDLSIKWPNDLYYKGRKLCGILTESKAKNGKIDSVVIGIGFNVNMPKDCSNFKREASCLREFSKISIEYMIFILSKAVKITYENLSKDYLGFSLEFTKRDFLKDKEISIDKNGETLIGIGLGVDDEAKLKFLDTKENKVYLLNAGEVSIL